MTSVHGVFCVIFTVVFGFFKLNTFFKGILSMSTVNSRLMIGHLMALAVLFIDIAVSVEADFKVEESNDTHSKADQSSRIPDECEGVRIKSRKEWRARDAMRVTRMHLPINHIIISHTVTPFCPSTIQCARWVEFIQDMHLDERGWSDIGYNFLIGGDGNVYEGRGWFYTGAHAINYNSISYGISFMGNFNKDKPTEPMINATMNLIKCGVKKGYISPTVEIHGHRDVACTESPGNNLYAEIRRWRNYKGGRLPLYYCKPLKPPVVNKDIIND